MDNQKTLIFVLILCLTFLECDAVSCYACEGSTCNDPFTASNQESGCAACRKFKVTAMMSTPSDTVIRSCIPDEPTWVVGCIGPWWEGISCVCNTDLCNGQRRNVTSLGSIILPIVLLAYFRCKFV